MGNRQKGKGGKRRRSWHHNVHSPEAVNVAATLPVVADVDPTAAEGFAFSGRGGHVEEVPLTDWQEAVLAALHSTGGSCFSSARVKIAHVTKWTREAPHARIPSPASVVNSLREKRLIERTGGSMRDPLYSLTDFERTARDLAVAGACSVAEARDSLQSVLNAYGQADPDA